jgi:hypothetical protein
MRLLSEYVRCATEKLSGRYPVIGSTLIQTMYHNVMCAMSCPHLDFFMIQLGYQSMASFISELRRSLNVISVRPANWTSTKLV